MREFKFKSFDGYELCCYAFEDVEKPVGVLQITHGMAEHAKRYSRFAEFLNKNGYVVVANDLRAHGLSAGSPEKVGLVVDDGDLFFETVRDQIELTKYIEETYKLPIFLLGHSYGSFLTQKYIQECQIPKAVVIMGSAYQGGALVFAGKLVADVTAAFCGKNAPAKMIANMSFGTYQKNCKDGVWLSRDKEQTDKYENDPYCGKIFSAGFYKSFFKGLKGLYTKDGLAKIPKKYPLLLTSGKEDGVGDYGKLVSKLYDTYKGIGLTNVKMKLYEGMRHEVLNEIGYEGVFNDLLSFFNANL